KALFDMVRIAREGLETRALLCTVRERIAHVCFIQARSAARRSRGTKDAANRVGQREGVADARPHRRQHAVADVVTERHGTQESLAADAELLCGGPSRGNDA